MRFNVEWGKRRAERIQLRHELCMAGSSVHKTRGTWIGNAGGLRRQDWSACVFDEKVHGCDAVGGRIPGTMEAIGSVMWLVSQE